jgi:3-oxoacyl-[acyl-carrier-protein] synthase I
MLSLSLSLSLSLPLLQYVPVPNRILPLQVTAYTATSAVGVGKAAMRAAVAQQRSGLTPNDFGPEPLATWIGRVHGVEAAALPESLARWECRNNRLAWIGLRADGFLDAVAAVRERVGPARVALILGTSTSSIGATEDAYRVLDADGRFPPHLRSALVHTPHSLANFVHDALDLAGPCLTVSTACSSSAKVFAVAERLLRLGLVDAAVVGGCDTLCGSVLFGFNALQLVSAQPCRPFDVQRDGINLGEAAGFALLERAGDGDGDGDDERAPRLIGYGESSDAHHMSTPHPQGLGAERALDDALARAGITADAVDHINLHGTASSKNDEVEAALVARRFEPHTHASSTKGFTGHVLGAAGIVGSVFSLLAIETGWMPGTPNTDTLDPACGPQIRLRPAQGDVRVALTHAFGFGGTNCVLAFSRSDASRGSA